MSSNRSRTGCKQSELVPLLAAGSLPAAELRDMEAHVASCSECREKLDALRKVRVPFAYWPTDVLRPDRSLWARVAERISAGIAPELAEAKGQAEPEWEEAAPGISCKLLATDTERGRVSMLVRLAPGVAYPPHMHAEFEELHLLDGELWIDDRKLLPGDFNRAEPGTRDRRVWTETGCTCFLTTSLRDEVLGPE